jgi:hypothetical protein
LVENLICLKIKPSVAGSALHFFLNGKRGPSVFLGLELGLVGF